VKFCQIIAIRHLQIPLFVFLSFGCGIIPSSHETVLPSVPARATSHSPGSTVYIGEADDLRERFMEHFNGNSSCTRRYVPTYFVFELIDNRTARESRYRELVRQHGPICNVEEVNQG